MSEAQRSRLYDWWCERADESLAEYAMSCLSPVPLPDLATKDDVRAVKEDLREVKNDLREVKNDVREVKNDVARLDTKVATLDTRVDLLATQHKSDRDEDRRVSQVRHYWLVGIWVSAAVPIWLGAAGVIG